MNILIDDTKADVNVSFENKEAPCPGCKFFGPNEDPEGPRLCTIEGRGLSAALIADCERFGWHEAL